GLGPVMTECPLPCERVTVLPTAPWPFASRSVTVMVVVLLPLAATVDGNATMPPDAAGGATKLTFVVCASVTPSVASVAVNVTSSIVELVTRKTTAPESRSDGPLGGDMETCA